MPEFCVSFFKLCPGGNPTIIVDDPYIYSLPMEVRTHIATTLLANDHLGADQVGFLNMHSPTPHLVMMGGEFCVNAVRSAAAVLARESILPKAGTGLWKGEMTTSGVSGAVHVFVREVTPSIVYESGLVIPLQSDDATLIQSLGQGETLVRLPGIVHLLLNAKDYPLPTNPLEAARAKRLQHLLDAEEAAGVVWYDHTENGCHIVPVVHVAATRTSVLESACGSASLALALHIGAGRELSVFQPSGNALSILVSQSKATISGPVALTACGNAYIAG